jgi:hypothetical protein
VILSVSFVFVSFRCVSFRFAAFPFVGLQVPFVFSEIDPDDHDMKASLDPFSYDAVEFSYDGIRYDAMITFKF